MADQILGWVWEHPFLPKFFSKKAKGRQKNGQWKTWH